MLKDREVVGNMVDDSVNALIKRIDEDSIRLLLAGPAGVGKSTHAQAMFGNFGISHISHDLEKQGKPKSSPCKLHQFDPYGCFSDAISSKKQFVIDIGAGTVFRKDKEENEARLKRMLDFKHEYNLKIVVLIADRTVVRKQFLKKGDHQQFINACDEWKIAYPWWQKCLDFEFPV